ncbi:MAG: group 1 glycosyl transferase [Halochromatium sp.]|nr:group 1 glycosyl transferase [Halochromatium sp.]
MRVLMIAHGHPSLIKGGGEIAAYQLFKELRERGIDAYLLAATREDALQHGGTPFSMLRPHEILFHGQMRDYFNLSPDSLRVVWHDFRQLLAQLQPDAIHFHHILHLGTQFIREAARYRANAGKPVRLIFTLHEYLPICANDGQMVMFDSNELCTEASPTRCAYCLKLRPPRPRTPEELFLRERLIRAAFSLIDHFIAPSAFLRQTYQRWGLSQPISVIDNGLPPMQPLAPRPLQPGQPRARFAYLGQINRYKGVQILLEAIGFLEPKLREQVQIDIHGCGLVDQDEALQQQIEALRQRYPSQLHIHGRYDRDELGRLFNEIDTLVLPSIWWENSPLVLQEAKGYGRPMICSDIGGMQEKVTDGVDGLRFSRGSAASLARAMQRAADPELWEQLRKGIKAPDSIQITAEQVLGLYTEASPGA